MPSKTKSTILVADDDEVVRRLLERHLSKMGHVVETVDDGSEAIALASADTDVALLDFEMPGADGLEVLRHVTKEFPDISVIMLSAKGEIEDAVEAMKIGAIDYLTKPIDMDAVIAAVGRGAKMSRLAKENRDLTAAVAEAGPHTNFVAASKASKDLLKDIGKIAPLDSTVLLTGPSGCGKTLLAREIHHASKRATARFVTVSCPALPRELLEAELFGHEKGAFTGAANRRIGKIELASGGTLFLDEIGELPLDLQPKLLNVLQDKQLYRVGGDKAIDIDVRIIAATNRDLASEVAAGTFREDLFYRLNVVPLDLPPLAARPADILPLAESILARIARERATPPLSLSPEASEALQSAPWPGNVRQLENVLDRASIFVQGDTLGADDLPADLAMTGSTNADQPEGSASAPSRLAGLSLAEIEKMALEQSLEHFGGNQTATARALGVSERTVYNKLRKYGLRNS